MFDAPSSRRPGLWRRERDRLPPLRLARHISAQPRCSPRCRWWEPAGRGARRSAAQSRGTPRFEHAKSRNAIRNSALMQLLQPGNLFSSGGDHELATLFERNTVLLAKALHGRCSGDTVASLQRASFVVETGMDDSAVMSGLMGGDMIFFFNDDEAHVRESGALPRALWPGPRCRRR